MKYVVRKILFNLLILPSFVYTFWNFTFDDGSIQSFLAIYLSLCILIMLLPTIEQMKQEEYEDAEKILVIDDQLKISDRRQLRECIDLVSIDEVKARIMKLDSHEHKFLWVLSCDHKKDVIFSNTAQGIESFLKAFSRFDDIDNEAYSAALKCDENKIFVLWKRQKNGTPIR